MSRIVRSLTPYNLRVAKADPAAFRKTFDTLKALLKTGTAGFTKKFK